MKVPAEFEWDDAKAATNLAKHKVPFPFAARVFLDPNVVVQSTFRPGDGESRCKAIGRIETKLYVVVFVMRGQVCRLISARRTNTKEDRNYGNP